MKTSDITFFVVIAALCAALFYQSRHTCPDVERRVLTYPTRNEMLEFLRQYGYKGTLDGEIGTGGNPAWGRYEKVLEREQFDLYGIEYYGTGEPK